MRMLNILSLALLGILLINLVNAATVYGTIYDLSLKKASNARVEISTAPKQFFIAQNGTYSFNAPNGTYTIKAQLMQKSAVIASVQENITIKQDGSYVLDLILFPDLEEGVEDIGLDVNGSIVETEKKQNNIMISAFILLAFAIFIGAYHFKKIKKLNVAAKSDEIQTQKEEKYEENGLEQIIKILRQEGGRATQKEIRKGIPLSEAKISLMIAELEHKGIIEKIKKGRGNIIILKGK